MTAQLALQLDGPFSDPSIADPGIADSSTVEPPDAAARRRIREDTSTTLFVEAGAGAGKTTALVDRVVTLVGDGVPIESIAAITFSEKAASELRSRLRQRLAAAGHGAAVDALDRAPIGTLHAFARRLLFEFPVEAELPPGFVVLDELESRLAVDERWEDLLDELLDDPRREVAPGLLAPEAVQLLHWNKFKGTDGLRRIIDDFQANWDLVEARVDLHLPSRPARVDLDWLAHVRDVAATPVPHGDRQATSTAALGAAVEHLAGGLDIATTLNGLDDICTAIRNPARCGDKTKWRAFGASALDELRDAEAAILADVNAQMDAWRRYQQALAGAVAGAFVLDAARARAAAGTLEFHDLLVLTRRLLAGDEAVRRTLHARLRHILLDEFQDTDPIQLDIAVRLTAPPAGQGADAGALVPEPGRLFVVGDPKQSIYRFRRADIANYLAASARLADGRESLTANFRSTRAVIEWVNGVFAEVIQPAPGVQPHYQPLDVCRQGSADHGRVTVLGVDEHLDDDLSAKELREREAASVAAAVGAALHEHWPVADGHGGLRPCLAGDITILLPARTSLPMLQAALSRVGIAYRAEGSTDVYVAPEVRDLMAVLRAAADPTDELSLITGLRSPLYGCSDVELYEWRQAGGSWNVFAPPPQGLEDGGPVALAITDVREMARAVGRCDPAELIDGLVERRRVLETALAGPDARDVWRRIRYLVDQACAWTDAGGRGLRRYLRWAAYQAANGRAGDTVLPEHDHDAVRIMTVHAAKGLEFPITVVSGLTTRMQGTRSMSVVWPPTGGWTLAQKDNDLFEDFRPLDEQMGDAERRRLLYVACTRAVDHLVVSLHRQPAKIATGTVRATSATVLAAAGATGHGAVAAELTEPVTPMRPVAEPLTLPWADRAEWEAERERALAAASVRSTTSATQLAHSQITSDTVTSDTVTSDTVTSGTVTSDTVDERPWQDPGLIKDGVDLDLPPWQRGRYGTAVGRAVHAVLQDVDLVAGTDVERLTAAQCAAEGIFGFEERVAALCRSALGAPIVMAAAAGAEHWRELFVVAQLGTTVLEGYVDLLVRSDEGLLIVDYKTDQWRGVADRGARADRYRTQLAAYGVALGRLLAEPVTGGIVVWCRSDGPADQHPIDEWPGALREVERMLGA
ncbi:MAG: UvrD-helicase domain-containing protein [Ilumatobacteraceae bacterium]